MLCPFCKHEKTQVIDTRKFDTVIMRIRICCSCLHPFMTHEEISRPTAPVFVLATDIPK